MEGIWWAKDIHHLPAVKQDELLVYYGAITPTAITKAIWKEVDLFAKDAQAVCQKWNLEYPVTLEQGVRTHLKKMGLANPA
jgi:hypothetical protein